MRTLKFRNNDEMPALGLGTWKSEPGEVYSAVKTAIKEGYRHIDCAPIYLNEKEVGQAITECIAEGIVSRGDLWITSKLWNTAHAKADVIPALKQTLSDLNTDYLDLFLIHWPVALKEGVFIPQSSDDFVSLEEVPLSETWEAMEETVYEGLAKHIGVSNFGKKTLEGLINNSKIKPEMNQVESHPYLQQEDLLIYCKANEVLFTAYSPLGSSDRPDVLKSEKEQKLLDDSVIGEIANAKNVTPAQVLISWAIQRGTSVIPKSVNPARIAQNFQSQQLSLSDEEMQAIGALDKGFRYITGEFWVFEGGPYTMKSIWA